MRVSFRKAVKLAAFSVIFLILNALVGFELFSDDHALEKVLGRPRHDNGDRQDRGLANASSAHSLSHDSSKELPRGPANVHRKLAPDDDMRNNLTRSLTAGTGEKMSTKLAQGQFSHARRTELSDVFISVKTTGMFHASRLQLVVQTWFQLARDQTYFFTDSEDKEMNELTGGHLVNTNCSSSHNRQSLCCKMSVEYDAYLASKKRWMCHFDDDIYVNIPVLMELLQKYKHTDDWYLGKPSLRHPIEVNDFENPGAKITFWFATGSAFCISRALALKMMPHAGGGRLMTLGEKLRLPDDCVMGYIIDHVLRKQLTVIEGFRSHLEALWLIKPYQLNKQITFSYSEYGDKVNVVNVLGFSVEEDPSRSH
ncbi:hypothetical protein C0Q70_01103 [Pomacea canaliculata]|uniref:Fringe-like glycosyltransferase domain-containing protein n=1 Tax=Pomacea canaliculata TaxID=400727 RepID=A0A2T7PYK7_POMCA|nr:hypothetical protein C0Q70_01103 [Pomacea canaliculata]